MPLLVSLPVETVPLIPTGVAVAYVPSVADSLQLVGANNSGVPAWVVGGPKVRVALPPVVTLPLEIESVTQGGTLPVGQPVLGANRKSPLIV